QVMKTQGLLALIIMSEAFAQVPDMAELNRMSARFAPTEMRVDISGLSEGDKKALAKLIQAARVYDDIFLRQRWTGNVATFEKLKQDSSPLGQARLHYFWLNKGPWSEIDDHRAFLPDVPARNPPGGN